MEIKRLSNHKSAQCEVRIGTDGVIIFRSYVTDVIIATPIEDNRYELECSGLYSMTTRKQIGWFLREYFPQITFADIKKACENSYILTV